MRIWKKCMLFFGGLLVLWLLFGAAMYYKNHVSGERALSAEDPLAILNLYIGSQKADILASGRGSDAVYYIDVTLPQDFDFSKVALNMELSDGAEVSVESNCLITELSGRSIINLMVENASLIIENDGSSRTYQFRIGLEQ